MSTFPNPVIDVDETELIALCQRCRIRKLSVFGSAVRPDFGPDSDIDLLVEYEDGHTPGWEIVDIAEEFSSLFGGRRIDLINPKFLNRHLRAQVINSAIVRFEASDAT